MRRGQSKLSFRSARGGARLGAGRKPLPPNLRHTPHRARPVHSATHPVHVTLRATTRSLRHPFVSRTLLRAFRASSSEWFRIVHYSVQENHVHLIVEAASTSSLGTGMRGLMVRVARRVNSLLFRRGRFWADRWHGRALTGPRQVRHALVYVLQNRRKHAPRAVQLEPKRDDDTLDPLSSAAWFDGFTEPPRQSRPRAGPPSVAAAQTWLLRVGWLRHGRIHPREAPRSERR